MPKTAKQLDSEIATVLRPRPRPRMHHAERLEDSWDVARDAILEHTPERAAAVLQAMREGGETAKLRPPRTFQRALHEAPRSVRSRFEALVPEYPVKPGKAEFEQNKPGEMTLYVPGHGYFSAPVETYLRYKRLPRAKLMERILSIYEGSRYHGGRGDKAAHWRGYDKDYLAMIVADAFGSDD